MTEKSFDDAPINYNNEEAHAWAAGYNSAVSDTWEAAAKEAEVCALHAEATENTQALLMAEDIASALRNRAKG